MTDMRMPPARLRLGTSVFALGSALLAAPAAADTVPTSLQETLPKALATLGVPAEPVVSLYML
ncbi:MAG: hypothetical protein WAW54_17720, partial [Parvibaculum sedimenti]